MGGQGRGFSALGQHAFPSKDRRHQSSSLMWGFFVTLEAAVIGLELLSIPGTILHRMLHERNGSIIRHENHQRVAVEIPLLQEVHEATDIVIDILDHAIGYR